jgi:hypothetical protein
MAQAIKESARLITKASGKDGIAPAKLDELRNGEASMLILYFAREGNAISAEDKEITLQMKMGPLALKARFSPKEMVYDGKLAI